MELNMTTNAFDDDKLREECGVFGIFNHNDAAAHTALGLHALQHRGQEAAGIVSSDGTQFFAHRAEGHVGDNFNSKSVIDSLKGIHAIGHVRYSTAGGGFLRNVQPLFAEYNFGGLAIAHNGNLTNASTLRQELINRGSIFQSTMDSEVFVHLIAKSKSEDLIDRLTDALKQIHGAYSLVAITDDMMIGARDAKGIRPLVIGQLDGSYILASETCALDIIGADFIRDVDAGEMVIIRNGTLESVQVFPKTSSRFCIFEYIYFARPDSIVDGKHVYAARKEIGRQLARENRIEADVVVPVPDSGVPSAIGYAEESKIPFELGIVRNHYVGRTFIEPSDHVRHLGVKLKHNANMPILKDKRVILVDDSIVRGTTSKKIVSMVRAAGAKEVHMCIASPPTTDSCYYGVDTPEKEKLLAAQMSVENMANLIEADSLFFISIEGLYKAMGETGRSKQCPQYCDACFTGDYPVALTDKEGGTLPLMDKLIEGKIRKTGSK
ncbi:MAG: amidophosphoribosyltransferase [Rickettsiales bacterium]|nr:amidophosphoribosyltransferase [Rickettsiales bacterium]